MNCFCGGEFIKTQVGKTEYELCKSCGYLRKVIIPSKKEEKDRYDNHICDSGYLEYMSRVYQKIKPYVIGECLDYGCGKIHALADLISKDTPCQFYDLYYYPNKPSGFFDTIILIEVFEHVYDIYSLMIELKRMLKEKGRIIIMTQVKKEPLDKWWYLRDITHVSFVDSFTMEVLANKTGLFLKCLDGYFVFEKE